MTHKPDHEVGYRRPPKHSRFQKGRSGNPRGRPCKAEVPLSKGGDLKTAAQRLASTSMPYKRDGKRVNATGGELLAQKLFTMAANGNLQAMRLFIALVDNDNIPGAGRPDEVPDVVNEAGDEAIIARFLARQGGAAESAINPDEGGDDD